MRIALVSTPFIPVPPPSYGGTELVVAELARGLRRAGHEVTVFATGDSKIGGLRYALWKASWPPDGCTEALHCARVAQALSLESFDVVHAHVPLMVAFAALFRTPLVHTIHHALDRRLSRLYARVPGVRHVAISESQAELEEFRLETVVHHGLSKDLYPVVGPGGQGVYFLGRLAFCKGPDLAIAAARQAGLPIEVAGKVHADDAPEGWIPMALARALREPHVRCVGEATLLTKRQAFARSRALLAPLRWEEPFGLALVEAALAGCPVIAFPRGAAPEIVEDGITGFLVEDVRAMSLALRFAGKLDRREIQKRARERFSSDRMTRDYLEVYRAAILQGASHGSRHVNERTNAEGEGWRSLAP